MDPLASAACFPPAGGPVSRRQRSVDIPLQGRSLTWSHRATALAEPRPLGSGLQLSSGEACSQAAEPLELKAASPLRTVAQLQTMLLWRWQLLEVEQQWPRN